jgi:hypothetical protein
MRVIRAGRPGAAPFRRHAPALVILLVGAVAAALALTAPRDRPDGLAVLAIAAVLGLGVGAALLADARRVKRLRSNADLVRLLGGTLDDAYILILDPRLPDVPSEVAALLVGPPGVFGILVRRWSGRYRVRGRGWEYDTRGRGGWIACRTNPTQEAGEARRAVARWAASIGAPNLPVEAAVAFPSRASRVVLEEPDAEVITVENAPWWANRVGRLQRMDALRAVRVTEAIIEAGRGRAATAGTTGPLGTDWDRERS